MIQITGLTQYNTIQYSIFISSIFEDCNIEWSLSV